MCKIEAFQKEFCWDLFWGTVLSFDCSLHAISESLQETAFSFGEAFAHPLQRLESLSIENPSLELVQERHRRKKLNFICMSVCLFIYIKTYTSVLVSHVPVSFTVLIFDIRTSKFSLFLCHCPPGWQACTYPCIWSSSLPCPHLLAEKAKGNISLGPGREVLSAR